MKLNIKLIDFTKIIINMFKLVKIKKQIDYQNYLTNELSDKIKKKKDKEF